MKWQKLITILVIFLLPVTTSAITYYISPSGNNANSGTSLNTPWQTISKVNAGNFAGDTILFKGGNTFSGSLSFTVSDVGTSSKPVVISSYGTGKAVISSGNARGLYIYNAAGFIIKNLIFFGSGVSKNTEAGIYFFIDKDLTILPYIRIDSVEVYGYHNAGISIGSSKNAGGFSDISITNTISHDNGVAGISIYGLNNYAHKNVRIAYTKVYNNSGISTQTSGNSGSGIVLGNTDGAVIEYCTAYNNGWLHSSPDGGPVGIWAYQSNNVLIQFNESHHNKTGASKDGGGFDLDGGCVNSTMQYNYSHDNYGAGFLLAQYAGVPAMQNIIVRYNVSENDGRKNNYGAIHLWSSNSSSGIKSVQIYNNTIYVTPSPNTSPSAFFIKSGIFSDVNIRNNIFQTTAGVQMISSGSATSGFNFQGNNYWTTGSSLKILWGVSDYSSLSSWRNASGQEKINGVQSGFQLDPQFSDTTTGVTFPDATQLSTLKRYKLKPTSGLIIQGLNLSSLFGIAIGARDFWGVLIGKRAMFNIGADQVTKTSTIIASADAYVRNGTYAYANYGGDTSLIVKGASSSGYVRNSYLKFILTGVNDIVSAKLRIFGSNVESTSNITISSFGISNDSWTEKGITWNNAPAPSDHLASAGVNSQQRYYEFDVTAYVKAQFEGDKTASFFIKDTTSQNKKISFNSKENLRSYPQLIIATTLLILARPEYQPFIKNDIDNIYSKDSNTQGNENNSPKLFVKTFPNPVLKTFSLNLKNKYGGDFYIQILDVSGRIYNLGKRWLHSGQSNISIDISGLFLGSGTYILKVYSYKEKAESVKFIVQ